MTAAPSQNKPLWEIMGFNHPRNSIESYHNTDSILEIIFIMPKCA